MPSPPRAPAHERDVLDVRRRVTVLDPQPLDRRGRSRARLRKLFAHALAQRGGERIDLTRGRQRLLVHANIAAEKSSRVCTRNVSKL